MSRKKRTKITPIPSDGLFKKIMEDVVTARDFLEYYLPDDFKKLIDLSKIKIEKESYIEENLKRKFSDIVYSVQTRNNEQAFVYVLIEAQSTCDYWIALRLWKYMLLLCERHKSNNGKLPIIAPLLFYNGTAKYNAPMNLWDLFTIPEQAKKLMSDNYKLIDLQSISDDEIKKKQHLGMLEFFMKHIHQRDMLKLWERFLQEFNEAILIDKDKGYIYIKHFLWYTDTKVSEDKQQELGQLITHHLSEAHGEDIMRSIAQKYIEEGEARGKAEGKAELIKLMFTKGKTVEEIIEFTGLPITEIEKLKS